MSLTRKDYEMIVYCLTTTSRPNGLVGFDENTTAFYYEVVSNFVKHLSADNPRFDREKFLDALDNNGWNSINKSMLKD